MVKILAVAVGRPQKLTNVIQNPQDNAYVLKKAILSGLVKRLRMLGHSPSIDFNLDYLQDEPGASLEVAIAQAIKPLPAAILTIASSARYAAQSVTDSIPIVFTVISDPEGEGAIENPRDPIENATGVSGHLKQAAHDCLEKFQKTFRDLHDVYAIHQPFFPPAHGAMPRLRRLAKRKGWNLTFLTVGDRSQIGQRLSQIQASGGSGKGLFVIPEDLVVSEAPLFMNQVQNQWRIPVFLPVMEFAGNPDPAAPQPPYPAIGAYGIPGENIGTAAAEIINDLRGVFSGTKPPHQIPPKVITKCEWWVNRSIANTFNPGYPPPAGTPGGPDREF